MSEQNEDAAIQAAVAALHAQRGRGLVVLSPTASPAMRDALRTAAADLGREVLEGVEVKSQHSGVLREFLSRDVPEISRTDERAFIKNLSKIARGEVRVK